jgi:hypothetical protein
MLFLIHKVDKQLLHLQFPYQPRINPAFNKELLIQLTDNRLTMRGMVKKDAEFVGFSLE